jgi:uncharacterized protein YgbK (DUF1537 family)
MTGPEVRASYSDATNLSAVCPTDCFRGSSDKLLHHNRRLVLLVGSHYSKTHRQIPSRLAVAPNFIDSLRGSI